MNITFHVVDGARPGQIVLATPIVIGRGRETKLTLPLPLISREHCEVFEQQGTAWVRDLGSTNGTLVSDQRIGAPTPIDSGQLLRVGSVTLRVEYVPGQDAATTPTADFSGSVQPLGSEIPPTADFGRPLPESVGPGTPAADPMRAVEPETPATLQQPGHSQPTPQQIPQQPAPQQQIPQQQTPGPLPMAMPIQPQQAPPESATPESKDKDDDLDDFLGKFN